MSADTAEQALEAERDGADYIGLGPIFATPTKADAAPPIGLEGLSLAADRVRTPIVAIGGITAQNAAEVFAAGAAGVAVIREVMAAPRVDAVCRSLLDCARR